MTAESESELEVRELFEGIGLRPRKVPTTNERTADFTVDGDGPGYLVEVKARTPPDQFMKPVLGTSPVTFEPIERKMRRDAKVGEYLQDSKVQMRTLDPQHDRLWFLWVAVESFFDWQTQAERIISTLYGFREAVEIDEPHRSFGCWYAGPAAFERYPEIDGVTVYRGYELNGDGPFFSFNLNEVSPRVDRVLASTLVQMLGDAGAEPRVPSKIGKPNQVSVPRSLFAEGGAVAVLRHVQEATGIYFLNFWAIEEQSVAGGRISLRDDAGPEGGEQ